MEFGSGPMHYLIRSLHILIHRWDRIYLQNVIDRLVNRTRKKVDCEAATLWRRRCLQRTKITELKVSIVQ